MIFIVLGHSAYHLATKTLVVGLVAFLCGLLGCLMSILALGIFWLAPTIRPQSPPHFKGKRPLSPLAQPRQLNALGVSFDPPPANLEDLQTSTDQEQPLPLGRSASFPDLHTADSHQTYRPASTRHVSFTFRPLPPLQLSNVDGPLQPPPSISLGLRQTLLALSALHSLSSAPMSKTCPSAVLMISANATLASTNLGSSSGVPRRNR
ncbi:hypothetical protein BS17DRAFT_766073 [Gyrodon lividus]|nr:hypothetical protein BS17DRAFT_766073 [Gyrodon lividus]